MKIALASDHGGFNLKLEIARFLAAKDIAFVDYGCGPGEAVDYVDFAVKAVSAVLSGACDRAILFCGTGMGMAIAANKFHGVRAAPCHDDLTAEMSRRHNDSNVLCLSADLLGERLIDRMVELWLSTPFEGGRHARRVEKIRELEEQVEKGGNKGG